TYLFATIASLVMALMIPTAGTTSTVPDEQLNILKPPTTSAGGYSGVYFDDQKTLQRAFYYVESGPRDETRLRTYVTCTSALAEPCKSDENLSFETPLSPCSEVRMSDCLIRFSGGKDPNSLAPAQFVETVTVNTSGYGVEAAKRYFTPFTGDKARGIPDSGYPSIWRMSHLPHQGGDEYLVVAKMNAYLLDTAGRKPVNVDVGIFPISRVRGFQSDCFFNTMSECLVRWPFPAGAEIELALKTNSRLVGWFYGRVTDPAIDVKKSESGESEITIRGKPTVVPIVAAWSKNEDLPSRLNQLIENEFNFRGKQFAGVCYFGCNTSERSQQVVNDERNPSFSASSDYFERYLLWLEVVKDRAYANKSTWSFRSLEDYAQYEKCIASSGVAGLVTTNSNAYIATPPIFQNEELLYKVASPHYDSKGEVQIGTYDLAIRSDVARCIYGFDEAPINATLNVIYENGEAVNATTVVGEKNGWLYLSAKGFTYSSPTVKVKINQEKPAPVVSPTPTPSPTVNVPTVSEATSSVSKNLSKKAITCIKGEKKKVLPKNQKKCPKGYKKA
ncbi:MAG: hypothetical protein ACO39F_05805, partial [Candidatus Nanopelagicaceae bacterium]